MSANVSPVSWYGGKSRLAGRIAALLPRHDTYVECFGGGASVLFTKPPAKLEVYNDLHGGLVAFFTMLRDRPEELQRALTLTPYARSEFEHCRDTWEHVEDQLELARRWYVRSQMAFGCSETRGWGFDLTGSHHGGSHARSFTTTIEALERFAQRFRRVQVEQQHWQECLARYDRPRTVIYADPPYHPDTRGRDRHNSYRHDLSASDHEQLLTAFTRVRCSLLVSGYPHPLYDRALANAGFERHSFTHHSNTARLVSARGPRTEVLWRRLEPGAALALPLWQQAA